MKKAACQTTELSIVVLGVSLGIYLLAFLNWPYLMTKCPSAWVGSIEIVFEPAKLVQPRVEHQKDVVEWRARKGTWKANYPEGWVAFLEIVETEPGLFQMLPKSPIPFFDE